MVTMHYSIINFKPIFKLIFFLLKCYHCNAYALNETQLLTYLWYFLLYLQKQKQIISISYFISLFFCRFVLFALMQLLWRMAKNKTTLDWRIKNYFMIIHSLNIVNLSVTPYTLTSCTIQYHTTQNIITQCTMQHNKTTNTITQCTMEYNTTQTTLLHALYNITKHQTQLDHALCNIALQQTVIRHALCNIPRHETPSHHVLCNITLHQTILRQVLWQVI